MSARLTEPASAPSAAARLRDQQQEGLRIALELERPAAWEERVQLEPIAEPEALRPLAVRGPEVAEEASYSVEAGFVQRGQERPRIALAEEAARVRDAKARCGPVVEPGEVVE